MRRQVKGLLEATLAGRLRAHAWRAKNEAGYRTLQGMPRSELASFLRSLAKQLDNGIADLVFVRGVLRKLVAGNGTCAKQGLN